MFTVEKYIESLKENLHENSDILVQNIREILSFQYYKEIELLDFEVFIQPFVLSIRMFSMDKEANEVFYEGTDENIFSGSHQLINDIEYYNLPENKSDDFWEFYEQNDETISRAEKQTIIEWFINCWNKANGKSVKLPAYLVFHDDIESYDLIANKWVPDEEKWSD